MYITRKKNWDFKIPQSISFIQSYFVLGDKEHQDQNL